MDFGPDHALQWTGVDRVLESIMNLSGQFGPQSTKVDHGLDYIVYKSGPRCTKVDHGPDCIVDKSGPWTEVNWC